MKRYPRVMPGHKDARTVGLPWRVTVLHRMTWRALCTELQLTMRASSARTWPSRARRASGGAANNGRVLAAVFADLF